MREARNPDLNPTQPYGFFSEEERGANGAVVPVSTILLTNRECPWKCVMCDLWKNTLTDTVPVGAIPAQIEYALSRLPEAKHIKLYNSGSFFDKRAIPSEDFPAIARLVRHFETVVVESHPSLVGSNCLKFRDSIAGQLQVAMGLETVDPSVLPRLNKGMTLDRFRAAADFLRTNNIELRTFILLNPPFMKTGDVLYWAQRSIDFAFEVGGSVATIIPTRGTDGSIQFSQNLPLLEAAVEYGIGLKLGRVFADLWDLQRTAECDNGRVARLHRMNIEQVIQS